MLAFFYSLFYAIITGTWNELPYREVAQKITLLTNRVSSLLINTLGGKFDTLQTTFVFLDGDLTGAQVIAAILAIAAIVSVCLLAFKLTKMVFSIFFGGR